MPYDTDSSSETFLARVCWTLSSLNDTKAASNINDTAVMKPNMYFKNLIGCLLFYLVSMRATREI